MSARTEAVLPTHIVIPDTQIEPGDPIDHMGWIGQYIVDQFGGKPSVHIVHLGDHAAMNSLSKHNSPLVAEGQTYGKDIEAANEAFDLLCAPMESYDRRRKHKWAPEKTILLGNHENHITRALSENPNYRGGLSLDALNYEAHGFTVHPFLAPVLIDGIVYSHFFVNNANGKGVSGMIETRLKTIGASFVQGHQQGLKIGMVETVAGRRRGIVAGSCYLKDEGYRGPQARGEWRGILVLHEVRNGDYDLMEVSLNYLCRKYEGVSIDRFMAKRYSMGWAA